MEAQEHISKINKKYSFYIRWEKDRKTEVAKDGRKTKNKVPKVGERQTIRYLKVNTDDAE